MRISIILFVLVLILSSCIFNRENENITDHFEIGYVDSETNRNIYYKSQGVFRKKIVYGMYYDSDFITLKIHPKYKTYEIIKDSIQYYIIDIERYKTDPNQEESKGLIGPLNVFEFKIKTKKLGIKNIIWKYYPIKYLN